MLLAEHFIIIGIGGLFLIGGVLLVVLSTIKKRQYEEGFSSKVDVGDFLEEVGRPVYESLGAGGWISIAIGILLLAIGSVFWLVGL